MRENSNTTTIRLFGRLKPLPHGGDLLLCFSFFLLAVVTQRRLHALHWKKDKKWLEASAFLSHFIHVASFESVLIGVIVNKSIDNTWYAA